LKEKFDWGLAGIDYASIAHELFTFSPEKLK